MKYLTFAAALIGASAALADTPVLTVYTYDSFTSDWGPGPAVEARTEADVVLGLDTNLTQTAKDTALFAPHGVEADLDLPIIWADDTFVPFDWGYFAFVHGTDLVAPANFKDLAGGPCNLGGPIGQHRDCDQGLVRCLWPVSGRRIRFGAVLHDLACLSPDR